METTLPIVRKLLLLAGMGLAIIGVVQLVAIVLNPGWWKILTQDGGGWLGDGGFLGNVLSWANVLQQSALALVWGLIAMAIGHMLPNGAVLTVEGGDDPMPLDPSA